MNTNKLKEEINQTLSDLFTTVLSFDQDKLNKVTFEGSSTGAQVTQHLIFSNDRFAGVMNGPAKETNRAFDQFVGGIKSSFLISISK
ncbi:MAG: hypothetical protein ACXWCZ_00635 [Flavisolibacter sp.]